MTTDLVKRLRDAEPKVTRLARAVGMSVEDTGLCTEAAYLIESQAKEIERLKASERSAWNAAVVRDEEIARLKAGGCARDQGLTQYCAEAAGMAKEIARLCHLWFSDADPKETEYRDQYAALKNARQMTEADVDSLVEMFEHGIFVETAVFRAHLMQFVGSGG